MVAHLDEIVRIGLECFFLSFFFQQHSEKLEDLIYHGLGKCAEI